MLISQKAGRKRRQSNFQLMAVELKETMPADLSVIDDDEIEEEDMTLRKRWKRFKTNLFVCWTLLRQHPGDWCDEVLTQAETKMEDFRLSLKFNWTNSWWGRKLQRTLDYLGICSCVMYIASTYLPPYHGCRKFQTDDAGTISLYDAEKYCTMPKWQQRGHATIWMHQFIQVVEIGATMD